jgi:predicted enzyme related to lactoylglutathione lyase
MKAKINGFSIVVNNKQAAVDFFTKKVGFEIKTDYTSPEGYRYVTLGPEGQDLELGLWEAGTKDPTTDLSSNWKPGNNPTIQMWVDDCRKTFDELKSRGVQFKQEKPDEYFWGITATFSDPDGNLFSINQRANATSWNK